jgi:hypothetical protein
MKNYALSLILFGLVFSFCAVIRAQNAVILDAPIQFYFIEKIGPDNIGEAISSGKIKKLFLKQFRVAKFHLLADLEPPFISKSMMHYETERVGGIKSSGIGYVHLLLMDDDMAHYASDSGQEVFLKSNSKSVAWIFDRKKALEMADKAGAKYAFVVETAAELIYQADAPKPVYKVSLNADLYEADNGEIAFHHDESMVKLGSTAEEAVWGACQFLSQKLVEEMQEDKNIQSGK